jgi:8-oxo-dGTP pyrophosphatase MutT (NUDIX family)
MSTITCPKGCCSLKTTEYSSDKTTFSYTNKRLKAGVFIYDPKTDSVLIVQSKGNLWGAPKGTLALCDHTFTDCALREVKEETGIDIDPVSLTKIIMINNNVSYFYTEMDKCEVFVQDHIPDNDANGIGWIKTECLEECIESGKIDLNHHFCIIYWKFLGKKVSRKL